MPARGLLIFTCEHASRAIPARYRAVADRAGRVLDTHRGYDPGTLELGRDLSRRFHAPLIAARCSRLLVELNRSLGHPALWSEFSGDLPRAEKERVLRLYYHPHREAVVGTVEDGLAQGKVVWHIGVHSFAPVLDGEVRQAEIGLLYDPKRPLERKFCREWKDRFRALAPAWRIRMNYPYRGVADGLTTSLRRRFPPGRYAGVELEINQALVLGDPDSWRSARRAIAESLPW